MKKFFFLLLLVVIGFWGYKSISLEDVEIKVKMPKFTTTFPYLFWDKNEKPKSLPIPFKQEFVSCDSKPKVVPCKDTSTGYIWSNISEEGMDWDSAKKYCENLVEDGYDDWRLPDIDELRSILNGQNIGVNGNCRVSAKNKCLDSNCWSAETCFEACDSKIEEECVYKDGKYSKLGDGRDAYIWLWSSSSKSDLSKTNKKKEGWYIDVNKGYVNSYPQNSKFYVRCVR